MIRPGSNPSVEVPKEKSQGSDDNGRHVFECYAFSHDV
ncbi:hypothetical protein DYY67_1528 [Candidatus Nitrosotalea sp. TS]|nr:hypothetical protein [Candidatus Nitrosotalea sp. TS]